MLHQVSIVFFGQCPAVFTSVPTVCADAGHIAPQRNGGPYVADIDGLPRVIYYLPSYI